MHHAITIYFNEEQGVHHILVALVDDQTGQHQITKSKVSPNGRATLSDLIRGAELAVGPAYVRAYTVKEVRNSVPELTDPFIEDGTKTSSESFDGEINRSSEESFDSASTQPIDLNQTRAALEQALANLPQTEV